VPPSSRLRPLSNEHRTYHGGIVYRRCLDALLARSRSRLIRIASRIGALASNSARRIAFGNKSARVTPAPRHPQHAFFGASGYRKTKICSDPIWQRAASHSPNHLRRSPAMQTRVRTRKEFEEMAARGRPHKDDSFIPSDSDLDDAQSPLELGRLSPWTPRIFRDPSSREGRSAP
jgi:hypothetical protein